MAAVIVEIKLLSLSIDLPLAKLPVTRLVSVDPTEVHCSLSVHKATGWSSGVGGGGGGDSSGASARLGTQGDRQLTARARDGGRGTGAGPPLRECLQAQAGVDEQQIMTLNTEPPSAAAAPVAQANPTVRCGGSRHWTS